MISMEPLDNTTIKSLYEKVETDLKLKDFE